MTQQRPIDDAALANLRRRYHEVRAATGALCEGLTPEDCQLQSMPECSPVKWHLAHTSWFFETFVLAESLPGWRAFDESFAALFNSYYQALGTPLPRPQRGVMSRPGLHEIHAWRLHVDAAVDRLLELFGAGMAPAQAQALERLELGLQHEQQHQELLLTDIKHAFSMNPTCPALRPGTLAPCPPAPALAWIDCAAGPAQIGHDGIGFAFDNERPRHDVLLPACRIATRCITNGEYLEFIRDGGYRNAALWQADGWDWVQAQHWQRPLYWQADGSLFSLRGKIAIDPHEPVCHLSWYEAEACARWAGARLPREEEWERLAAGMPVTGNFAESGYLHPRGTLAAQAPQLFGNVWTWTASPYAGYPGYDGYRAGGGALGEYNGKFMCNQFVLRGGSCASPARHLRASYRNFFAPQARWQFSGLRLAQDAA